MASPLLTRRQCCIAGALGLASGARASDVGGADANIRISTLALESDPTSQLAAKVLLAAYRRLGMEMDIVSMPGERTLVSANAGETDGELYRKAGLEKTYPNLVMVPVPVASYEVVAFVPRHSVVTVSGWASLRVLRIGFVKGIKVVEENTRAVADSLEAVRRDAPRDQGANHHVESLRTHHSRSARCLGRSRSV